MKHVMPILPYAQDSLAPKMSAETMSFHYGKHLQTYVDNLNKLIGNTMYEGMEINEIICKATGPIYNNAAQVWNHTFFFMALSPTPTKMSSSFAEKIVESFGSVDAFKEQLFSVATGLFGSGWAWLVADSESKLSIVSESNAGNPLRNGLTPILTIDVWEHAYYIDYRNRRAEYIQAVWDLIDWKCVEKRIK